MARPAKCLQADDRGLYCPRGCQRECWVEGITGDDLGPREPVTMAMHMDELHRALGQLWATIKATPLGCWVERTGTRLGGRG